MFDFKADGVIQFPGRGGHPATFPTMKLDGAKSLAIVDLRLLDSSGVHVFLPEELRGLGVPEWLLDSASLSIPPGFAVA